MEKQLSYRATIARPQVFRDHIYTWLLAFSSWPRLLLEVFTRRNFGERYFSMSSAVLAALFLAYYPFYRAAGLLLFSSHRYGNYGEESSFGSTLAGNVCLYGYLIAFIVMAIQRRREVKRIPGQFDFSRYSLSTGEINPLLLNFTIGGKPLSLRTIQTLIEPGLFFFIGFLLWAIGQSLGLVLMVCAVFYSLSYRGMYRIGDNYVLDQIDKMIVNRQMVSSFVDGLDPSQTQGFQFFGNRPADPTFRRELAARMIDKDEAVEAV